MKQEDDKRKSEKLYDGITGIRDEFIELAEEYEFQVSVKHRKRIKLRHIALFFKYSLHCS